MDAQVEKNRTVSFRKRQEKNIKAIEGFFVKYAAVIAITALTILVVAILFELHNQDVAAANSKAWVTHTYQVRGDIRGLLAHIDEVVISERGYLISGNEDRLKFYNEATEKSPVAQPSVQTLNQELAALKQTTADNPVQQANFDQLGKNIGEFIAYMDSIITLRRTDGIAALDKLDPNRGEEMINRLHGQVDAMVDEENRLLLAREQTEKMEAWKNHLFILYGMSAIYILVVLSIWLCQKAERRAQAKSAADAERYSIAIQGLSVGLWDWDIVADKPYYSERFSEMLGLISNAFHPDPTWFSARLHPEDRDVTMAALNAHLRNEGPYDVEYRLRHEDGHHVWIHACGQALWDKSGKPLRMVGSAEDITTRKESEREIKRHVEALTRSNQELDDFAYIASHDLKEPLRGLVNNAMFLKEDFSDKLNATANKHLDRMIFLCQRMEKLMDDLLYFSRLGRQDLAIQPADLNDVIADIRMMMETTLQQEHATIVMPQPLPTVVCDLPRITEVFRNLITNAVKYNKNSEKRVEIGCTDLTKLTGSNGKRGTAFYVRDNGVGIPEQFYGDIFRIFKRLNEEDESVRGSGVGLTFVKKIVERHGGKIWPESKVGVGTTFYFTLKQNKGAIS